MISAIPVSKGRTLLGPTYLSYPEALRTRWKRDKPISSMYDVEFIHIDLREDVVELREESIEIQITAKDPSEKSHNF